MTHENDNKDSGKTPPPVVEHFSYEGEKPGETLVIFGAVHGNERCGPEALLRLKEELDSGTRSLEAGKLIIVPVANPGAYAANTRFLERNLNRSFYPKPPQERKAYEDHLDDQLCALLDEADYLLDIHSYTAGGAPFVFMGCRDSAEKEFAQALGVEHFVWDWSNAFYDSRVEAKAAQGTTEYLRGRGGRGVTLECGQHEDPANAEVAYTAALRAMAHLGLIAPEAAPSAPENKTPHYAKMVTAILNTPMTAARPFRHFEAVQKGDLLAQSPDGKETVTAKADGFIILPNPNAVEGAEILYLAVAEEPFPSPQKTPRKTPQHGRSGN